MSIELGEKVNLGWGHRGNWEATDEPAIAACRATTRQPVSMVARHDLSRAAPFCWYIEVAPKMSAVSATTRAYQTGAEYPLKRARIRFSFIEHPLADDPRKRMNASVVAVGLSSFARATA
jgi:hypothetical protein